jgi:AcrR family transcriptional regulator
MSATPVQRRSQAERSSATRQALIDATIECLVHDGYANTTTSRVAERAGVSRGAHLHHFQTRQALVAAAAEQITLRRSEVMLEAAANLPAGREGLARGLDLMWDAYSTPLWQGALDLWTHARTDPELRALLVDVERLLDRQTLQAATLLFPDQAQSPDFERLLEMALATARGLALLDTLNPQAARNRKQWPYCRTQLVELFERAGAPR